MIKTANELGQETWEGVELSSPFSTDLFHEVGVSQRSTLWVLHTKLGSLVVRDRLTGFGWVDTETGYRSPEGKFWLAFGNQDVRNSGCKTIGEAIEWVKLNADICEGE